MYMVIFYNINYERNDVCLNYINVICIYFLVLFE